MSAALAQAGPFGSADPLPSPRPAGPNPDLAALRPFDRLAEPDLEGRARLAEICAAALRAAPTVYVIANDNTALGSSNIQLPEIED